MRLSGTSTPSNHGFTIRDLLALIVALLLLGVVIRPSFSSATAHVHKTVDLSNLRQILRATALYAAHNDERLPHPGWGSIDGGGGSGPDSWAYATANKNRIPDAPAFIPSAIGKLSNSNQIPFFKAGLLGSYLSDPQVLECPTDVAERSAGTFRAWYLSRSCKLGSYTMSGAVSGYGGNQVSGVNLGQTFKMIDFSGSSILFWESDESTPFNFNDSAANPVNQVEGPSRRHSDAPRTGRPVFSGGALVGRLDGSSEFIDITTFIKLRAAPAPNDLLTGPGFR